jgi:hypothetical protein
LALRPAHQDGDVFSFGVRDEDASEINRQVVFEMMHDDAEEALQIHAVGNLARDLVHQPHV